MTREEEIKQAAKANASQMCNLCLDKYCLEMCLTCPNFHESVTAFTYGAKWADEHINLERLWHDASEEPLLEGKEIIFLNEQDIAYISEKFCGTFSYMLEDFYWEEYVNLLKIIKWVYVRDLLPKGVKK